MAVNWNADAPWQAVPGVELAVAQAGIRYRNRDDVVLLRFAVGTTMAGVFTRNAFCAAPVHLARARLEAGRAWLINAGNANAGTSAAGLAAAEQSCALAAQALELTPEAVLPFSTGVIGEALRVEPFDRAIPGLVAALDAQNWPRAARAIMTTDTLPKLRSRTLTLADGRHLTLTGMAKGAGMIAPDMATLLAFVATDAPLEASATQAALRSAVAGSFNAICVDGDTSTNDACVLAATGAAGGAPLRGEDLADFQAALDALLAELAQGIVRDAEGATRLLTIEVEQAESPAAARQVADCVATSPLVKTAAFAGDPNWGRILAAVGRSGLPELDVGAVDLWLDEVCLIAQGEPHPEYTEARGAAVCQRPEYTVRIRLGRGAASARVWTCDYSYDYVRINAEYRS